MDFYKMPKIDLHCHLDGSMELLSTQKMLRDLGEDNSIEELKKRLCAPMDCQSLAQYLECFDLPIKCIQTREGLFSAARDLALDAAKENVKYLEVRFAPSFSTSQGLSICEIIESVQQGLLEARKMVEIRTGILVCGMRNLDMETNLSMLRQARELLGFKLSERRVFPALDITKSSTRREDLLLDAQEQEAANIMRRAINGMKTEEAVENILNMFAHTKTNFEYVQQVRKKKFL